MGILTTMPLAWINEDFASGEWCVGLVGVLLAGKLPLQLNLPNRSRTQTAGASPEWLRPLAHAAVPAARRQALGARGQGRKNRHEE
jgi:hypothetical protein